VLLLDSEEHYDALITQLSEYIKKIHTNAIAYHNRGLAYLELGMEEGLSDIQKSINLDDTRTEPHRVLGAFWERNNNLEEALYHFSKAIELDVNDPCVYRSRASVYEKSGDLHRAIDDLSHAIRLDPNFEYTKKKKRELLSKIES
jgi:tetratricopeptide (TPR) repeat protein